MGEKIMAAGLILLGAWALISIGYLGYLTVGIYGLLPVVFVVIIIIGLVIDENE